MAYTERDNSTNYLEQIRNMLQQRSGMQPMMDPYGGLDKDPERTSLAKLIRNGSTSVIQAVPARPYSPVDMKMPPALHTPLNGYLNGVDGPGPTVSRRLSNGFEEGVIVDSRRFSASTDLPEISPESAGSGAHDLTEHDSPAAKVPVNHPPLSPSADPLDSMPISPKSETGDSISSEQSFEPATIQYTNLLRQQLLQRQNSLLHFRQDGGSDAEAEHTSNSPSSSELHDSTPPPPGQEFQCQLCDFHSASRFHFNSHMNTHQVHRCPIPECNYSTRTEGRLRRHVKGHHEVSRDSSVGGEEDGGGRVNGESKSRRASDVDSVTGHTGHSSGGKVKTYRCKTCVDFVATTKAEHFEHLRLHIKPEKQLACPLDGCRFVTEYKHHLEYHVRNHSGSKPFKCPQTNCNYTCVNKSMLNSHMKSHSNFYQYRCECGYATKYCHSLKLHLKKYNHKATNNGPESAQISMAGSNSPPQVILPPAAVKSDEREGKRRRKKKSPPVPHTAPIPPPPPTVSGTFGGFPILGENTVSLAQPFPYGLYPGGFSQFQAASIYNNLLLSAAANGLINPALRMTMGRPPQASPEHVMAKRESPSPGMEEHMAGPTLQDLSKRKQKGVLRMLPQSRLSVLHDAPPGLPLDLSGGKENGHTTSSESRHSDSPKSNGSSAPDSTGEIASSRRRRKGPAFKIDLAVRQRLQETLEEDEEDACPMIQPQSPEATAKRAHDLGMGKRIKEELDMVHPKRMKHELACEDCGMAFEDGSMYTMHMGFHSRQGPFVCGLCGHQAADRVSFFLHIAKAPHY